MLGQSRLRRIGAVLTVSSLLGVLVLVAPSLALACGLDGKPSMSTNGALVERNLLTARTQAQALHWAPFVAVSTYHSGATIALTENRTELARTLLPTVMTHPWRWGFGDGATAYGWTVHHAYKHAGRWRVTTDAYDPISRAWYNFDQAVIVVR